MGLEKYTFAIDLYAKRRYDKYHHTKEIKMVPYAELYRIAEIAHIRADEEDVRDMCMHAATQYGEPFKIVYNKVRALYMKEFVE
jgi:hypothetical protein